MNHRQRSSAALLQGPRKNEQENGKWDIRPLPCKITWFHYLLVCPVPWHYSTCVLNKDISKKRSMVVILFCLNLLQY